MASRKYPLDTNKATWENPTVDVYPLGVKEKILWENPETGATIIMIKYPEGVVGRNHTHTKSNEAGYYLQGEVEGQNVTGLFGVNPKGVEHGKARFTKETTVILSYDGPR